MNTEQKTPEQWFQQLKEPYRSEAINNLSKKMSCYIEFPDSLIQALNCSFQFADSNEGNNYWWEILRSIKSGKTTYLEAELKPQDMNNEKRIPFDWEKYQSGEYEAVCRDDEKPEQLTHNPNAKTNNKISFWYKGEVHGKGINGRWLSIIDYVHDLYLIPKPKKFQAWVNLYDTGAAITWSNEDMAKKYEQMNNGFLKTILIEWEG